MDKNNLLLVVHYGVFLKYSVGDISSYVKKLPDELDSQNFNIKKQILQTFVEEIIVFKERITIRLNFFGLADRDTIGGSGGN